MMGRGLILPRAECTRGFYSMPGCPCYSPGTHKSCPVLGHPVGAGAVLQQSGPGKGAGHPLSTPDTLCENALVPPPSSVGGGTCGHPRHRTRSRGEEAGWGSGAQVPAQHHLTDEALAN